MRIAAAVLLGLLPTLANAEALWTFVWVGATNDAWLVVEGQGAATRDRSNIHFALLAKNSEKYVLDASIVGEKVEAGFAGVGPAYCGVTYLRGTHTTRRSREIGECSIEIIQLHNEISTLTLKRRICENE